jgi:hypothetical protein
MSIATNPVEELTTQMSSLFIESPIGAERVVLEGLASGAYDNYFKQNLAANQAFNEYGFMLTNNIPNTNNRITTLFIGLGDEDASRIYKRIFNGMSRRLIDIFRAAADEGLFDERIRNRQPIYVAQSLAKPALDTILLKRSYIINLLNNISPNLFAPTVEPTNIQEYVNEINRERDIGLIFPFLNNEQKQMALTHAQGNINRINTGQTSPNQRLFWCLIGSLSYRYSNGMPLAPTDFNTQYCVTQGQIVQPGSVLNLLQMLTDGVKRGEEQFINTVINTVPQDPTLNNLDKQYVQDLAQANLNTALQGRVIQNI